MISVSILVPMYGVERYIEQCAHSLLSQSYERCEFIFVDDASKDNSLQLLKGVIEQYPQRCDKVKIIECETNGGVAAARNRAIDAASGNYILFVDADDWVVEDMVERLVLRTIECDADICNAWCMSVDKAGKRTKTPARWLHSKSAHLRAVLGQSHIVTNHLRGMLISRELLTKHSLRFTPGVDFGEDYSLMPQLIYYAKTLSTLPEYLYMYRVENQGSYMNNIGERQIESYIAAEHIVTRFVESLPDAWHYRRALRLGKLNIKKWIFRRGRDPRLYNESLLGSARIWGLRLRIYNRVLDGLNPLAIKLVSVAVNLPLYIKIKIGQLN